MGPATFKFQFCGSLGVKGKKMGPVEQKKREKHVNCMAQHQYETNVWEAEATPRGNYFAVGGGYLYYLRGRVRYSNLSGKAKDLVVWAGRGRSSF